MNRSSARRPAFLALVVAFTIAVGGIALAHDYEPVRPPPPQPGFTAPILLVCRTTNIETQRPGRFGSCTVGTDNLQSGEVVQVTASAFNINQTGGQLRQCTLDLALCEVAFVPFTTGSQGNTNPIGEPDNAADPQITPTNFTVRSTFVASNGQTVNCLVTACVIYASLSPGDPSVAACHGLTFAGGVASACTIVPTPTTTTPSTTTSTSTTSTTTASTTTSSTSTTVPSTTTSSTSTTVPTTTTSGGGATTTTQSPSQCAQLQQARTAFNAQLDATIAAVNASSLTASQKAAVIAQLQAVRAGGNAQIDRALAGCTA